MTIFFKTIIIFLMFISLSGFAQTKPIKIVTEDFPPFQTLENGQITGPMYAVMVAICAEAKIQCDIQLMDWKDAYRQALDGEADVVFSILLEVPERANFFLLSPSIVNTSYSFFVTSRNKWKYTGFKSLDGMTIGAYGPSGTSIVAQETVKSREIAGYSATPLIIEPSIVGSFQQLITGKYGPNGAVVVNRDVGLALLKKHSIIGPKPAGDIKDITYGFGVSRKSPNKDVYYKMIDALRRLQAKNDILEILRWHGLKASPMTKDTK
jgi:polar amino acid transport system substrate-binding protein